MMFVSRNLFKILFRNHSNIINIKPIGQTQSIIRKYNKMSAKFAYPSVRREDLEETKFNVQVADPYRYLEDADGEETKQFVDQQNAITNPYLDQCPHKSEIKQILTKNQDYPREGCFFKRGDKYYLFRNSGLQPQAVLYQLDALNGEPRIFFDPNQLSTDGTTSLNQTCFSPDGVFFAYGLSKSGSDWVEIRIMDTRTGKELSDKLVRAKFTAIAWTHDNDGFFYSMYPNRDVDYDKIDTANDLFHSIYYHKLNTDQREDVLKVEFPDQPKLKISGEVSDDGKLLHVFTQEGCNLVSWYYCTLDEFGRSDKLVLQPIYEKPEAEFNYITNNGNTVYFRTNLHANNYRICKLDLDQLDKANWIDIIPNHPADVLSWAEPYSVGGKDYMLVCFTRKVVSELELRDLDTGKLIKKFELPTGTIYKISGRRHQDEIFFQFSSFITPSQVYHFNLHDQANPVMIRESKPNNFNPDDFEVDQIFYKSKDNTEIPMFLVHRKDMVKDGSNPCILYGYGGFNIKITPGFNINRVAWYQNFKGILAVANIRGGGELGQDWWDGGRLLKKQNCFDDFCSAAEYLIENKYTQRDKLAIEGGSNGGLLVAACSNQRPDLFGATVCHVGVLDMTRYTKFTCGSAWTTDYGDPDEEESFKNLIRYSPYHTIPKNATRYPATLLLTADHDDRVVPAHSLKFIAQLQHELGSKLPDTPLIIRVDTKAGHGGGKPTSKIIDEYVDVYSFLYNALGLDKHFTKQ